MKKETLDNIVYLFDRLCAVDAIYTIQSEDIMENEKILKQLEVSLSTPFDSKEDENNKIDTANHYKALIENQMARKLKLHYACMKLGASFTNVLNSLSKKGLNEVYDVLKNKKESIIHKAIRIERIPKFKEQFRYYRLLSKRYSQYMEAIEQRINEKNESVPTSLVVK